MAKDKSNQKNQNAPVTVNTSEFSGDVAALRAALDAAEARKAAADAEIEKARAALNAPLAAATIALREAFNAFFTVGSLDDAKDVASEFGIGTRGKTACAECGDFRHGKNSTCSKKAKAA